MLERKYQKKLRDQLMECVGLILVKIGTREEGAGWPDLYVPSPIWHGWIELKVGKGRVSGAQRMKIRLLNERGVPAVVMRWTEDGERIEDYHGELLAMRVAGGGVELLRQLATVS
tara:strand:- start:116 stop:460 length:345 start_codon:yes stop_codon:yes gene_type:complete